MAVGKDVGAVYWAVLALALTMVPSVALPPAIPFTSHTIATLAVGQNVAAKFCVKPSATFAASTHPVFRLTVGYGCAIVALGILSTGARARASALRVAPLLEEAKRDGTTSAAPVVAVAK